MIIIPSPPSFATAPRLKESPSDFGDQRRQEAEVGDGRDAVCSDNFPKKFLHSRLKHQIEPQLPPSSTVGFSANPKWEPAQRFDFIVDDYLSVTEASTWMRDKPLMSATWHRSICQRIYFFSDFIHVLHLFVFAH